MRAKLRVRVRAGGHLGEVVPIMPRSPDEVWQAISSIQELAERGEIAGIAIAASLHDGGVTTCYALGERAFTLMAAIRQVERRVESEVPIA